MNIDVTEDDFLDRKPKRQTITIFCTINPEEPKNNT